MSAPIDRATIEAAITAIEESGGGRVGRTPARVRQTSVSSLAMLSRRGERLPAYCLKVRKPERSILPTATNAEQLPEALEYEMMVRVREHMSRFPGLSRSIVRAVGFLACHDAIVTEYAAGVALKDKLPWRGNMAAPWDYSRFQQPLEICGVWLASLHKMEPPAWLPVWPADAEKLERRVRESVAALPEALQRALPMDEIMALVRQCESKSRTLVVSHGDFQPGNILIAGSQITVVDLGTAGVRPVEDDLAFFMTHMFTHKQRIVFGNLAGSRLAVRQLCNALLEAYGLEVTEGWRRMRPMLAVYAVERLRQMWTTVAGMPWIARPLLMRRLTHWTVSELPFLLGVEAAAAGSEVRACKSTD